jgi:hypothetical protein
VVNVRVGESEDEVERERKSDYRKDNDKRRGEQRSDEDSESGFVAQERPGRGHKSNQKSEQDMVRASNFGIQT